MRGESATGRRRKVVLCCFSELARSGCRKRKAGAKLNSTLTTSASANVRAGSAYPNWKENGRSGGGAAGDLANEQRRNRRGEQQGQGSTNHAEQQAFGEQLPNESATGQRPWRSAPTFAYPPRSPHQQQARYVHAGHQQQQTTMPITISTGVPI